MQIKLLKSKIHRATITSVDLNYIGSISVDEALMDGVGLIEYERVDVLNITNGHRIQTYVIKAARGSGVVGINGAAAHLMKKNDLVLFYHSVVGKEVVGIAIVSKEYYPDPTTNDSRWVVVNLKPIKPISVPVTLDAIKTHPELSDIALVKQSRLSVMPLTKKEFNTTVFMDIAHVNKRGHRLFAEHMFKVFTPLINEIIHNRGL